ncbi:uncharacterized protein K452DRAFT_302883 [Aplosporella prunicola CBS 121167]|uniref:Uncharacterized protein n=1 Tax=Aplosporella prunicola CBS 121167 TaxID=1176127 RepID=A0A6A6B0P0_9PEZI|nr:uncharacterized protein K452DRAFT_302883 [Aplosporella prunicola CBS 121167]KAF2136291.1 hypothetical protein K452DRAFT_302883 [Aplosporella prunicola CBS 121167]
MNSSSVPTMLTTLARRGISVQAQAFVFWLLTPVGAVFFLYLILYIYANYIYWDDRSLSSPSHKAVTRLYNRHARRASGWHKAAHRRFWQRVLRIVTRLNIEERAYGPQNRVRIRSNRRFSEALKQRTPCITTADPFCHTVDYEAEYDGLGRRIAEVAAAEEQLGLSSNPSLELAVLNSKTNTGSSRELLDRSRLWGASFCPEPLKLPSPIFRRESYTSFPGHRRPVSLNENDLLQRGSWVVSPVAQSFTASLCDSSTDTGTSLSSGGFETIVIGYIPDD